MAKRPLVEVRHLKKYFTLKKQILRAVDDVSFSIYPRETLGVVGESGCGKTTLGRALIHFFKPTGGDILFEGKSILHLPRREINSLRHHIQYIFQDPFASLNPRMTVGEIIAEPLVIHLQLSRRERELRVQTLLNLVGLNTVYTARFPHEFSGGQRQRIGIARALALDPHFIVCDEPIAALDVSIQAQIVNLLKKLQREKGLTYLFISHDLSMVKYISTRIIVMYLGHLMEQATSEELYKNPLHPYTQALLEAIPVPDPQLEEKRSRTLLKGDVPSPINPPKGCVFCNRCPQVMPICRQKRPSWTQISPLHQVACHLYESGK